MVVETSGKKAKSHGICIIICLTVEVLGAIFQVLGKPRTSVDPFGGSNDQRLPVHKDFRHLHFMNQTWHFATLGGSSGQLPIQLPIPEDGIFECLWEEEMDFFPGNISFGDVHLLEECLDLDSYVSRFVKLALMQDPETEWPPSGSNLTALNCNPKTWALIIDDCTWIFAALVWPNHFPTSMPQHAHPKSSCVLLETRSFPVQTDPHHISLLGTSKNLFFSCFWGRAQRVHLRYGE